VETTEVKPPVLNVRGSLVGLGPFLFEHYQESLIYIQDPVVSVYGSGTLYLRSTEANQEEYKQKLGKDSIMFTIFELENLKMIGQTSLRGIDNRHGTATFGISIGLKEYWGHGYGSEATKLTLDYGFRFLNLHNIKLRTSSFNERAVKAYEKSGFKEMGRRRGSILVNNTRYDEIYMDVIASEFKTPEPGWILPF
jgi:RimJ/RimL family protein N-acetyltransferase